MVIVAVKEEPVLLVCSNSAAVVTYHAEEIRHQSERQLKMLYPIRV